MKVKAGFELKDGRRIFMFRALVPIELNLRQQEISMYVIAKNTQEALEKAEEVAIKDWPDYKIQNLSFSGHTIIFHD